MNEMTSLERVLTSLSHKEPDRVPFFLLLTGHGARELNLSVQAYFSKPQNIVTAQLSMRERYRHDCVFGFFYAAQELEAFGGDVCFFDDGPPNAGRPVIEQPIDIQDIHVKDCMSVHGLCRVLETIERLNYAVGGEVPVLGVVVSPFSLPVMQMGFESYIQLIYHHPDLFSHLMEINISFCTSWANAQLAAGATAICYFDPVSSPTILPRDLVLKTGFKIAKTAIGQIKGPVGTHLASGRTLPVIDDLAQTGTTMIGCSAIEDLSEVKAKCRDRLTVLGNLNGITMRRWSEHQTREIVKKAIHSAGAGGGFILSDNHGEIPWQVREETLTAISETIHSHGVYPLSQV